MRQPKTESLSLGTKKYGKRNSKNQIFILPIQSTVKKLKFLRVGRFEGRKRGRKIIFGKIYEINLEKIYFNKNVTKFESNYQLYI